MRKFTNIVLVGEPNSGKSTLLNRLVGEKLSIVTHKAQTTRKTMTGIMIKDECQIVVYDTPGLFNPGNKLERTIVGNAKHTISDNDNIYIVVDSQFAALDNIIKIIEIVAKTNITILFNKIDIDGSEEKIAQLEPLLKDKVKNIFRISALKGIAIQDLIKHVCDEAEESEWHYPEDDITTIPERELAAEVTREKFYLKLHQELPYSIAVETELWKETISKTGKVININQVIYTKRESHKKMIIGGGGENIKKVGILAREDLEKILGCKVNLILFVKVRANWEDMGII